MNIPLLSDLHLEANLDFDATPATGADLLVLANNGLATAVRQALSQTLDKEKRRVTQRQSGLCKSGDGQRKLYARRAPEVDCISQGKARTPSEFGVKVGTSSMLHGNLIVGARAFLGNPDGHTLNEKLEQATILMQDSAAKPARAFVDLGYRGVDAENPDMHIVQRARPCGSASRRESCVSGAKLSNPSSATSKPISAWTAVNSKGSGVTGCMQYCARRATASAVCCA